ncbi:transcription factor Spi-C-like [Solea senegalensis]|uniref:Transcription factor Spi-C-like n=1 Tax=Solea senegalensis TaxID=28829 RepID=A0AAV6QWB7_SOLSE|nr:transcription factor Spi-C isoform X2 [Solea senegalensis]KAG7496930.1 transcription factor Spi-C-like [Solea senegalensis]
MASAEGNTQVYKMTSLDTDINQHFQDAIDVIQHHSNNSYYDSEFPHYETLGAQHSSLQCHISCCPVTPPPDAPAAAYDWSDTAAWPQVIPDVSLGHSIPTESPHFYSIVPPQRSSKGRKKLRLYEYLHEALNDPNMGDSIQWTDSGSGTFHFISKNKEKLAECWGQRKGNRKTMTYQKMARALRNYSRTGEIIKVRRKLTYQFNPDILHKLGSTQVSLHLPCHAAQEEVLTQQNHNHNHNHNENHNQNQNQAEQNYFSSSAAGDWHSWYGHYQLHEDYDLAASFTSHSTSKL